MSTTEQIGARLYADTEAILSRLRTRRMAPARGPLRLPRPQFAAIRRPDVSLPGMHFVTATREGKIGGTTSSGLVITPGAIFVALPSTRALYRTVRVVNPEAGIALIATVEDIGPWNEQDHQYVFDATGTVRPQAESGVDQFGRATNGAGIDLSDGAWLALRMTDNSAVYWQFVDLPEHGAGSMLASRRLH